MGVDYITWAINELEGKGFKLKNPIPTKIQDQPWAQIYRFETDLGFFFLKIAPPALSIEAKIIKILYEDFHANVPILIANNLSLHCFLMSDSGIRLYDYFKKEFDPNILIQVVQNYTSLQMMTSNRIEPFLAMGVPDWRLIKLPMLYQELIQQEYLLIDDGLTTSELNKLKELQPKLVSICDQLSKYNIKDAFGHGDFHDKNILINTHSKVTTIIDLGEVVITHPFFSFLNCLYRAKENFSLSDADYKHLVNESLKPWLLLETQEHLYEILALIQQCWPIHSVLGEIRLMRSVDEESFHALRRQGRLSNSLRYWLKS